ncbi:MAG: MFS transporter [Candidatus Rokubacteria bacterium]|nr:MFS transporter [Candidatus Rokubacteria bacterium]MBI2155440.1 MFS transporter [Candidatus Rokubacteria bacterium]
MTGTPMRTSRVFFGWWVVASFAVMIFLSTGIRFAVGPFLKPMVADLGLDRASFSLVIALSLFLYGAFQPFVGRLVDLLGVRLVLATGVVVLAGSLAATGLVTRLWHLYLVYGVCAAAGLAATGHVVGSAVIARWFTRRRATALSALGGASMAGMSLLVPAAMWLILRVGWRATYVVFGVAVFVLVLPLVLWIVRESPEAMGLAPDGAAPATGTVLSVSAESTDVAVAVQTPSFWQLAGGLFSCGFSMSLISAHGVPMLTDHGYTPMVASWALGILGGTSIGFAVVAGLLADRLGRRPILAWLYGARAVLFAALFLVRDQPPVLFGVAVLGGAAMSGSLAMSSALSADIFGRFSVGSVFGTIFFVHQVGATLGSSLAGVLFEATGGYGAAFAVASTFLAGACLLSLTIDEHRRPLPRFAPVAGGR